MYVLHAALRANGTAKSIRKTLRTLLVLEMQIVHANTQYIKYMNICHVGFLFIYIIFTGVCQFAAIWLLSFSENITIYEPASTFV